MIFRRRSIKTCRVLSGGEKVRYDVQNDDGKSQHIDDRRAYKSLGFRVNSGI
jgi:hypothetical protein